MELGGENWFVQNILNHLSIVTAFTIPVTTITSPCHFHAARQPIKLPLHVCITIICAIARITCFILSPLAQSVNKFIIKLSRISLVTRTRCSLLILAWSGCVLVLFHMLTGGYIHKIEIVYALDDSCDFIC